MRRLLFCIITLSLGVCQAQTEKFLGKWVSTTELMSNIGEIPSFSVTIHKDSDYLYLAYCYTTCDNQKNDCCTNGKYSGKIPLSKIKGKSFEIDIKSSKNEEGRLHIMQHKEYLYWRILTYPESSGFLPCDQILARDIL